VAPPPLATASLLPLLAPASLPHRPQNWAQLSVAHASYIPVHTECV
jgi:hypothetical protein